MSYIWHHEKTERNVRHMALSKRSQSEKSCGKTTVETVTRPAGGGTTKEKETERVGHRGCLGSEATPCNTIPTNWSANQCPSFSSHRTFRAKKEWILRYDINWVTGMQWHGFANCNQCGAQWRGPWERLGSYGAGHSSTHSINPAVSLQSPLIKLSFKEHIW